MKPTKAWLRAKLTSWESILAVLALALLVLASVTTPGFASSFNATTSLALMAEKLLMVMPMALLIIARDIDISVASTAALCGIVMTMAAKAGMSLPVALLLALLAGGICGALNGLFVAKLGLPPLVVTLGSLALFRGLCYVILGGKPISEIPAAVVSLGNDTVGDSFLPLAIVPFIVLAPVFAVILHCTPLGRRIYAIGGNPDAATYAGVRGVRIRFGIYVVTGLICAIAGVILVGRTAQASPDAGLGFELDVITITFLGGFSADGGRGRMTGAYWAGVLVLVLRSFLQLHNVSGYTQGTAVGMLLILSLLLTNVARRVSARIQERRDNQRRISAIYSS